MFDLFRFVMLRPARTREPHEILSTANDTALQRQLERDRERPSPGAPMERTADDFLKSEGAVSSVASLAFGEAYDTLAGLLRAALPANRGALLTEIRNAFGRDAADLIQEQGFRDDRLRLADTLIAAKLGTPRIDLALEMIARNLRLTALIQRAAAADARLDTPDGIRAALDVGIALPEKLLPIEQPLAAPGQEAGERPPGDRERPSARPQDDRERQREQALREYHELSEAHDFLRDLRADDVHDAGSSRPIVEGLTEDTAQFGAERPEDIGDVIFRELRELLPRCSRTGPALSAPPRS